jgi:hypothetical protein
MKTPQTILLGLLLICGACGEKPASKTAIPPAASPSPMPAISRPVSSADVVKASVADIEIAAGKAGEAQVQISISPGYHVNANPATFPYLIATTVEAGADKNLSAGKPIYPPAAMKTFSFEKQRPLAVYEGVAGIKLPVQAGANAEKGQHTVPLKVRVQACDDAACYAPATLELPLRLTVK